MSPNKRKYKIVVLSDLNKSSSTTLRSTIGLAKIIHGEIEVFHVKKPSDIVESDNQLSAMRTINSKHTKVDKELQGLTTPISKEFGMDIKYSFAFGNVKNEISAYIEKNRPDIVVLGKRKSKPLNLMGDSITEFVLNVYHGAIMIASDKGRLVPNKEIALGTLNSSETSFNLEFAEDLLEHTQKPLKSFSIVKKSRSTPQVSKSTDHRTIEYVFEHNDGAIKNLSNYLLKNNINVLSIDRTQKDQNHTQHFMMPDINSIIGKLDVTLLVSGKQKFNAVTHK